MKALITGVAGFIGSALAKKLLDSGMQVSGIDRLSNYYDVNLKLRNLNQLAGLDFIEGDLNKIELAPIVDKVDYVFHLAGQAGVRPSWGKNFDQYVKDNIEGTQSVLEACKGAKLLKLVNASSSSVYGDSEEYPVKEDENLIPLSPYGVTKLAAEKLCYAYSKAFKIPIVSLRYFTVYGPGQRPDMAIHKFFTKTIANETVQVYGDGFQVRDFTYISDVVDATYLAAISKNLDYHAFNIAGGNQITINQLLDLISKIAKKNVNIQYLEPQRGDARRTQGDTSAALKYLNWEPTIDISEGLQNQYQEIVNS